MDEFQIDDEWTDGRYIHGIINYPGNVEGSFDVATPKGPDTANQLWWFLDATYDEDTDKTQTIWTLTPPDSYMAGVVG